MRNFRTHASGCSWDEFRNMVSGIAEQDCRPAVEHLPIFVYGTLQRGEVRAHMWPARPVKIETATVHARLYDLGPYPALGNGDDIVGGELWRIRLADFDMTVKVLDQIECYGNDDVDLYVRRIVDCQTASGIRRRAYTYYFANPAELDAGRLVPPGDDGVCRWRRKSL